MNLAAYTGSFEAAIKLPAGSTVVLGKNVRKISKGAFKNFKKATTLVVKTKKLKKLTVMGSLKGSKVKVKIGKKKTNKRYKTIFTNYES